jgi:hypothetical protein
MTTPNDLERRVVASERDHHCRGPLQMSEAGNEFRRQLVGVLTGAVDRQWRSDITTISEVCTANDL